MRESFRGGNCPIYEDQVVAKEAMKRERKFNTILYMNEETATGWMSIEWNDNTVYNMNAIDYNRRSRGLIDLP